jgi:hypothetical protein
VRKVWGYHSVKEGGSGYVYARDNLAFPLHRLDEMLQLVRSGIFVPDAKRSAMWPTICKSVMAVPIKGDDGHANGRLPISADPTEPSKCWPADEKVFLQDVKWLPSMRANVVAFSMDTDGTEGHDQDDSSTSSSEDDVVEDPDTQDFIDETNLMKAAQCAGQAVKKECSDWPGPSDSWWRHRSRKTRHFSKEHDRSKFSCSRKITVVYVEIEEPKVVFPFCKDCFMR